MSLGMPKWEGIIRDKMWGNYPKKLQGGVQTERRRVYAQGKSSMSEDPEEFSLMPAGVEWRLQQNLLLENNENNNLLGNN